MTKAPVPPELERRIREVLHDRAASYTRLLEHTALPEPADASRRAVRPWRPALIAVAVVIVVVAVVAIAVFDHGASRRSTPAQSTEGYQATGTLAISPPSTKTAVEKAAKVVKSAAVHTMALEYYPQAGKVTTVAHADAKTITVVASSVRAASAVRTVNAHMEAYLDYIKQVQSDAYTGAVQALSPTIQDLQRQIDASAAQALTDQPAAQHRDSLLAQRQVLIHKLQTLQVSTTLAGSNTTIAALATGRPTK